MKNANPNAPPQTEVPIKLQSTMSVLLEANHYALQTGSSSWDFAVGLAQLHAMGLSDNDFRWLIRKGLVKHQQEVTIESTPGRTFQPTSELTFTDSSCFLLTDMGISVANKTSRAHVVVPSRFKKAKSDLHLYGGTLPRRENEQIQPEDLVPTWKQERRELQVNGVMVKRFKWLAANQETVLVAFEEESWPYRIDDPLPPRAEQNAKRRLSDTIKCLNRNQINPLIQFRGDGTGEGVTWEIVAHTRSQADTELVPA